jgi:hypothetical protein
LWVLLPHLADVVLERVAGMFGGSVRLWASSRLIGLSALAAVARQRGCMVGACGGWLMRDLLPAGGIDVSIKLLVRRVGGRGLHYAL